MGRKRKKNGDSRELMEQLAAQAVELFEEPYDDREGRDEDLPSVRFVAEKMNTTVLRARKLLITAGCYSTETSRKIRALHEQGVLVSEIMEATGLGQASVYSYLPYLGLAWNLEERTANADRLRTYRRRKNATENLIAHLERPDVETYLWKTVMAFEGYPFLTARGLRFSYALKRGKKGLPTAEIEIDRKEKTITKATICLAFHAAIGIQKREGYVSGPKKIGGFGASYLYPMFLRLRVIRQTPMT